MTSSPTPAVLPDARALVTKMVEDRKSQLSSCERMLELLQPEWDKFQARTGHDTYVARDYAEHTSAARKHRTEIAALEAVLASNLNGYIDGYEDALEVSTPPASDAAVPAGQDDPKPRATDHWDAMAFATACDAWYARQATKAAAAPKVASDTGAGLLREALQRIQDEPLHTLPIVTTQRMRNIASFALIGERLP